MYTAAGGKKIANEGEDITMVTGTNEIVQTNLQTVDITSVRQICLQVAAREISSQSNDLAQENLSRKTCSKDFAIRLLAVPSTNRRFSDDWYRKYSVGVVRINLAESVS